MGETDLFILPVLIFVIAALYSSVGHGGASGYLAVLSIMGVSGEMIQPSALLLNICVSGLAFIAFASSGYFRWKLFWQFALGSALGIVLLIASVKLLLT